MRRAEVPLVLVSCAMLAACVVEAGKPYEPNSVRQLARCEDQALLAHTSAGDCVHYNLNGVSGFEHAPAMHVRYTAPSVRTGDGAVAIDLYSEDPQPNIVREAGLKGYDYPAFVDVSAKGGDILVPLQRADGQWVLSVWLWAPNFIEEQQRREDRWVHAGDIPLGRVLQLRDGYFVETASPFQGPLHLTLYRAMKSRIDRLGELTAETNGGDCRVTPDVSLATLDLPLINACYRLGKPQSYGDCYGLGAEGAGQCRAELTRRP